MPKKRAPLQHIKPTTPVHPSLSASVIPPRSADATGNSVNELLQRHRLSGNSIKLPVGFERSQTNISTVPPSWNALPHGAPTPRRGIHRRPAGPPPPNSWLDGSANRPTRARFTKTQSQAGRQGYSTSLKMLPDLHVPPEGSLVYQTLKALAKRWNWHARYDRYHLATIPVRYKEILIGLIRCSGLNGTHIADLKILFSDEAQLENAPGTDELTHLDLSHSIGQGLSLKELKDYIIKKPIGSAKLDSENVGRDVPDVWEDSSPLEIPQQPVLRFPFLTHLSLSNPINPSWKQLLDIASHLATITHLSLAYWPAPSLTPNSKTAYRETPRGNVDYSPTNYYSHSIDNDWSEAAAILKRLSKATYCLKWLDLTGCRGCVCAMQYSSRNDDNRGGNGTLGWTKSWRGLQYIKVGQGWIPEQFREAHQAKEWIRACEAEFSDIQISEWKSLWRESLEWAAYEEDIDDLKAVIPRALASAARENPAARHRPTPWWPETPSSSSSSSSSPFPPSQPSLPTASYPSHITLDRGWDAWWIKEALELLCRRRDDRLFDLL